MGGPKKLALFPPHLISKFSTLLIYLGLFKITTLLFYLALLVYLAPESNKLWSQSKAATRIQTCAFAHTATQSSTWLNLNNYIKNHDTQVEKDLNNSAYENISTLCNCQAHLSFLSNMVESRPLSRCAGTLCCLISVRFILIIWSNFSSIIIKTNFTK